MNLHCTCIYLQDILKYTAETDPLHYPLPPPKDAATALKMETLKKFKSWYEKFAVAYPKLNRAMQFLQSSKAFDFERVDVQLEVSAFNWYITYFQRWSMN